VSTLIFRSLCAGLPCLSCCAESAVKLDFFFTLNDPMYGWFSRPYIDSPPRRPPPLPFSLQLPLNRLDLVLITSHSIVRTDQELDSGRLQDESLRSFKPSPLSTEVVDFSLFYFLMLPYDVTPLATCPLVSPVAIFAAFYSFLASPPSPRCPSSFVSLLLTADERRFEPSFGLNLSLSGSSSY